MRVPCFSPAFAPLAVAALAVLVPAPAGAAVSPAPAAWVRPAIDGGFRATSTQAASYAIVDLGAPPAKTYAVPVPVAFDSAGRILLSAESVAKGFRVDCLVFDGNKYIDLTAEASVTRCYPQSISNPSTGSAPYVVVGYLTTVTASAPAAFYSVLSSKSHARVDFNAFEPSQLAGVNAAGTAVGASYYNPLGGFETDNPPFVSNGKTLAPLQPTCTTAVKGCLTSVLGQACPFDGCTINAGGTVLGFDGATGAYATFAPSGVATDLPLTSAAGDVPLALNDLGDVVYYSGSGNAFAAFLLQTKSGKKSALGTLPGNSCSAYVPVGENNADGVLGFTSTCSIPSDAVYWTWTPSGGMQNLNAALPPNTYASILPIGIDDNGRILASLTEQTGATHVGLIEPTARRERARSRTHPR